MFTPNYLLLRSHILGQKQRFYVVTNTNIVPRVTLHPFLPTGSVLLETSTYLFLQQSPWGLKYHRSKLKCFLPIICYFAPTFWDKKNIFMRLQTQILSHMLLCTRSSRRGVFYWKQVHTLFTTVPMGT